MSSSLFFLGGICHIVSQWPTPSLQENCHWWSLDLMHQYEHPCHFCMLVPPPQEGGTVFNKMEVSNLIIYITTKGPDLKSSLRVSSQISKHTYLQVPVGIFPWTIGPISILKFPNWCYNLYPQFNCEIALVCWCLMFLYISLVLFVTLFLSTSAHFCWMNSVLSCLICFCILLFRSRYSWRWISLSSPFSFTILLWSASVKPLLKAKVFSCSFFWEVSFLADSSTALYISCHSSSGVDSSGSSSNRTLKRFFTSTL